MSNWTKKGLQIQSIRIPTCVWECVCIFPHNHPTEPIQPKSGQGVGMASNELIQQTAVPRQMDGRTSFADIYIHFPHGTSPLFLSLYTYPNCPWTELDLSEVNWSNRNNWLYVLCLCLCVWVMVNIDFRWKLCLGISPKINANDSYDYICMRVFFCGIQFTWIRSEKHQAFSTSHYNWHFPGWGKTETCTTEIWATGISLNAINRKGPRMIIIGF